MTAVPRSRSADGPSLLKRWYTAIRPFSLPASISPVIFGTVTAVTAGQAHFRPVLFLLSLVAMMAIHGGANIINDVVDYKKGLDRDVTPVSGSVVRGWLSPRTSIAGGAAFFIFGSLLGLIIALYTGPFIIWLGAAGVAIGLFYTLAPVGLKYRGLGDLAVFLDFGVFGALGAWTVQTGSPSWTPVIWPVPISLLVVAILHANNWRDCATDGAGGFRTVAQWLGDMGSQRYYGFLIFSPFVLVLAFICMSRLGWMADLMPLESLVTLCSIPAALALWKKALRRRNPEKPFDFIALDGATARFSMIFGLLYSLSFLIHAALAQVICR